MRTKNVNIQQLSHVTTANRVAPQQPRFQVVNKLEKLKNIKQLSLRNQSISCVYGTYIQAEGKGNYDLRNYFEPDRKKK